MSMREYWKLEAERMDSYSSLARATVSASIHWRTRMSRYFQHGREELRLSRLSENHFHLPINLLISFCVITWSIMPNRRRELWQRSCAYLRPEDCCTLP